MHGNAPPLEIRSAMDADSPAVHAVALAAFGKAQGPEIVDLIDSLSKDASAMPVLSFVATCQARVVGHILFSSVRLTGAREQVAASILAPLCVHPDFQQQGIGGSLIRFGLSRLQAMGVGLVFVLGHPGYYPRHGFVPAGERGLAAPYPIPPEHADAWMVQALRPDLLGTVTGTVACAQTLTDPRHWQE
ncbi:putative acetyltransferase [Megalodesulfovibrio gigas DSM 1382 = ATCC 19364]|uniref:Putative acetyltransferase n=1 Tax=Megalodesulfovibrio gigas (strain ATCC 19364 / DSM 1382 / NCIMB 9332 / VKM B-1759) TaxID=1121448 RepID=T2GC66_MEGG1|nr:putative acetyltransferase [Megalodesulfovibrio gigas DSM 1382 = ATCC 19364]